MTPAELAALPDGTPVKLDADVVNPKPDRRQRHDWRAQATILAGFTWVLRVWERTEDHGARLELVPVTSRWAHQTVVLGRDGFTVDEVLAAALLPHLVVTARTLKAVALTQRCDVDIACVTVVTRLLAEGRLTLGEVEQMLIDDNNKPEVE